MGKLIENEKANKKMAEVITEYLRNSMEAHQQEIEGMAGTIGFEEFSFEKLSRIERIKELRRNEVEPNEIKHAIQQLEHFTFQYESYVGDNGKEVDLVSLKPEEIQELLSYVKEGIENSGLGDIPMSLGGNRIIIHILGEMYSNLNGQDVEKQQRIEQWFTYLNSTDNTSLSQDPDKQYTFMYGYIRDTDELLRISSENQMECLVKTNGDVEYRNKPAITREDIKEIVGDVKTSDLEKVAEEVRKDITRENREGVSLDD